MSIQTIINPIEMRHTCQDWRLSRETIAFVPTMGALHNGHLALVQEAKARKNRVVVSIFVNPLQFGPKEDFAIYPRTLAADLEKLTPLAIDALFLPNANDMYPAGFESYIVNNNLSNILCGRTRPDHFRGVLTVVAKLLHFVQPDLSLFGAKDYQQYHLIRKMTEDLSFPGEVLSLPTVREKDGLAMSSRNSRLTQDERNLAPELYRAMQEVHQAFSKGERKQIKLLALFHEILRPIAGFRVEYAELRRCKNLAEFTELLDEPAQLIIAAQLGSVRLIDNLELSAL